MDTALRSAIEENVRAALQEDIGSGDLTASLVASDARATAQVICRDDCVVAGIPWVDEVYRQIDPTCTIDWQILEGSAVAAGDTLCNVAGNARAVLTGERTALNFLQLLSATATAANRYANALMGTATVVLDTRKTIPGLRLAQKHAVRIGGADNHRFGLYDAILIKENHIASAGGIDEVMQLARDAAGGAMVEIEVESLDELRQALVAGAKRIMLDNFDLTDTHEAVRINREEFAAAAKLEASGGKTLQDLRDLAAAGVDYISVGTLTKDIKAIDLSMRVILA